MSGFFDDVRLATRSCRRNPAFTLVVVLTLGVGIGAATLVFSLVNAVLYRLYDSYPAPDRLVLLLEDNRRTGTSTTASARNVADWKAAAKSFDLLGGMAPRRSTISSGQEPQSVFGLGVTEDILPMLGGRPVIGRTFTAADHAAGAPPVAVLAHSFWRQQFGARADVVGEALTIDGRPYTVVGVLAPTFTVLPFFGADPALVVPLAPERSGDRSQRATFAVARLRQGASIGQAAAEMHAMAAGVAASDPASRGWDVTVRKARGLDLKGDAGFVVALGVGVCFVLLIVCANAASLLLGRAVARSKEMATRLALGAKRWRIARQLLVESTLLAGLGSLAGLFLTYWAGRAVTWAVSGTNLAFLNMTIDWRAAAFAAATSAFSALAAGLVPSLRSARTGIVEALKAGGAGSGRLSPARLRAALVGGEIALAIALLTGAGVLLEGLVHLRQNDPGFDPRQLASISVTLSGSRYEASAGKTAYVEQALAALEGRRDLAVAAASFLPAVGAELSAQAFGIEGRRATEESAPSAGVMSVSSGFFSTMRIPLERGRDFTPEDRDGALPVAIVNARLVAKWLPGRQPIGSRIEVEGQPRTIVGVVGDVRTFHLNVNPAPTIYVPYSQRPSQAVAFVVRARADLTAATGAARTVVRSVDRTQVIRGGQSFEEAIARTLGGFDMTWILAGVLALVALGLASVGLYSVVAYSVVRRTREIGVRMALGAGPARVVREVVRSGLSVALFAAIPGTLIALAAGKLLSSRLHGVSAFEPTVLGTVLAIVLATVLLASYVPARRAACIDPVRATRSE